MKKLLTLLGITAFALGAFADAALPSGTSFENHTFGEFEFTDDEPGTSGAKYWVSTASDIEASVTTYAKEGVTPYAGGRPAQFSGDNTQYLKIESASAPLYRAILPVSGELDTTDSLVSTNIGSGLYVDTLVQFSVAQGDQDVTDSNVKLAIWVQTGEEDGTPTNFYVHAGYFQDSSTLVTNNYKMTTPQGFDFNGWHRLTVKAIGDIGGDGFVGFVVFVDGDMLTRADNATIGTSPTLTAEAQQFADGLLPSAVHKNLLGSDMLSAVGFSGNGSVDDISFTATAPDFAKSELVFSLTVGEGVTGFTLNDGQGNTTNVTGVAENDVVNFTIAGYATTVTVSDVGYASDYKDAALSDKNDGTINGLEFTLGKDATNPSAKISAVRDLFTITVDGTTHGYATLKKALEDASLGTIVLQDNYALPDTISITGDAMIDLAGKNLTAPENDLLFNIAANTTLTIVNSTENDGFIVGNYEIEEETDATGVELIHGSGTLVVGDATDLGYVVMTNGWIGEVGGGMTVVKGKFDATWNTADDECVIEAAKGSELSDAPVDGYWVVSRKAPEAPTYNFTVAEITNATATWTVDGVASAELTGLTNGTEVVVTYTANDGYRIATGKAVESYTINGADRNSDNQVTIEAAPTPETFVISIVKTDFTTNKYETVGEAFDAIEEGDKLVVLDDLELALPKDCSNNIEIPDGVAITFVEGDYTFSGTFDGAGTVAMTAKPKAVGAARFAKTWTGTFQVAWNPDSSDARINFNDLGNANSKVEIVGVNGAFIALPSTNWGTTGGNVPTILPEIVLSANWTVNNGWNTTTTLSKLSGTGNLTVNGKGNTGDPIPYTINSLDGYTGTLAGTRSKFTLGDIAVDGTPAIGYCLVKLNVGLYEPVLASATVNGAAPAVPLCRDTLNGVSGVYLTAAQVVADDNSTIGYASVENALAAADAANASSVNVLDANAEVVAATDWSYANGVYTSTRVVATLNDTNYTSLAKALAAAKSGDTVTLVAASSEAVTIPAGVTVAVTDDVVFSGKLSGAGAIKYTKAPASFNAAWFVNWTGTFVVAWDATNASGTGLQFNTYGVEGSVVEIAGNFTGYAGAGSTVYAQVNPTVKVTGTYTPADGSSTTASVFKKVTGSGTINFAAGDKKYAIDALEDWSGTITCGNANCVLTNLVSGTGSVIYSVSAPQIWVGDDFGGTVTLSVAPQFAPTVSNESECEVVIGYNWSSNANLKWYGGSNSTITVTSFTGNNNNTYLPNSDVISKVRVASGGTVSINNGNPLSANELAWNHERVIQMPALKVDGTLKFEKATISGAGSKVWNPGYVAYYYANVLDASGVGSIEVGTQFALRIDAVDFAAAPTGTDCLVPLSLTNNGDSGKDAGALYGPNGVASEQIPVTVNGEATEQSLVYNAEKGGLVLYVPPAQVTIDIPTVADTTPSVTADGEPVEIVNSQITVTDGAAIVLTYTSTTHEVTNGTIQFTAADGYTVDASGVTTAQYVAKIDGGSTYTTLQAAIDATAQRNSKVVLVAGESIGATVPSVHGKMFYFYDAGFEHGKILDATGNFITTAVEEPTSIGGENVTATKYSVVSAFMAVTISGTRTLYGAASYNDALTAANAGPLGTTVEFFSEDSASYAASLPMFTYNEQTGIYTKTLEPVAAVYNGVQQQSVHTSLADAVGAADAGQTVKLLANVTLDARVNVAKSVTIDLAGYSITRTAPPNGDNGSAFRVDGAYTVTIKGGTIDCSGVDDSTVLDYGVFAIDAKNGASLTLTNLTVTVNSKNGACVYPWAGSSVTILDGTYANTTQEFYGWERFKNVQKGMAVNQANVATQLLTIYGGSFKQIDPSLGDDSASGCSTFLASGYVATWNPSTGYYDVAEKTGIDAGESQAVVVDPTGKTEEQQKAEAEAAVELAVTIPGDVSTEIEKAGKTLDQPTYQDYFKKVATPGTGADEGKWVVTAELDETKVFTATESEEAATEQSILAAALGEESTAATVRAAKPGLYYSMEASNDIGFAAGKGTLEGDRTLATGTTVDIEKPNTPSGNAVFFRVKVSRTDK